MCSGGGVRRPTQKKKSEFKDAPPTVTGRQTGVSNPKDTKGATESLKIKRREREGTTRTPEAITTFADIMIGRQLNQPKVGGKKLSNRKLSNRKSVTEIFKPPSKGTLKEPIATGNKRTRKNIKDVFAIR